MIDLNNAIQAQDKLLAQFEREPWLRGIAVLADEKGSHYLRINVEGLTEEVKATLPQEVDGVPIVTLVIGTIRAL